MSRVGFACAFLLMVVSASCLLPAGAEESKTPDKKESASTTAPSDLQTEAKAKIRDCMRKYDNEGAVSALTTLLSKLSPEESEKLLRGGEMFEDSQQIQFIPGFAEARKNGTDRDARIKRVIAVGYADQGAGLLRENRLKEAVTCFQNSTKLDDKNPCAYSWVGLALLNKSDPALTVIGMEYLRKFDTLVDHVDARHLNDSVIGLSQISVGQEEEGIKLLEKILSETKPDSKQFRDMLQGGIDGAKAKLAKSPKSPVEAEKRKYSMGTDDLVVVSSVNKEKNLVKLAVLGKHDPDAGKQDGTDDGIIEMPMRKSDADLKAGDFYKSSTANAEDK